MYMSQRQQRLRELKRQVEVEHSGKSHVIPATPARNQLRVKVATGGDPTYVAPNYPLRFPSRSYKAPHPKCPMASSEYWIHYHRLYPWSVFFILIIMLFSVHALDPNWILLEEI